MGLMNNNTEHLFMYFFFHLCVFFGDILSQIFYPFKKNGLFSFLLLRLKNSLCIQDLSSSSYIWFSFFTNFSKPLAWLFFFLTTSFKEQNILIWIKSNLSNFLLWCVIFTSYLKIFHLTQGHKNSLLCFLLGFL